MMVLSDKLHHIKTVIDQTLPVTTQLFLCLSATLTQLTDHLQRLIEEFQSGKG